MAWPTAIPALTGFPGKAVHLSDLDNVPELHLELFRVDPETIWKCFATGNQAMLDDGWLVPDVCKNPIGIWVGLGRPGQEVKLCYAGNPTGDFAKEWGMNFTLQKGRVFLVFSTPDFVVAKWRWVDVDSDGSGFPTSHNTRFGAKLWPQ